jgi:transcriptional regulator NrdR family protein
MYKVQKKDGSLQDFDKAKIISGIVRSGATPEEAEQIIVEVETWLPTVVVEEIVSSHAIREKVLETLRAINPTAVSNFENYQKA